MTDEPREVELKFALEPALESEVLDWLRQGRRARHARQNSVYFDTHDGRLRKAGLALRVRESGGRWVQTIKTGEGHGGRLGRGEWEHEIPGPLPDLVQVRLTPAGPALGPRGRLHPFCSVSIDRRSVDIRTPDALIEACVDAGEAQAGARCAAVCEVELELKSGARGALLALARDLANTFDLPLSVVTKAERGFALAGPGALAPRKFRKPLLAREMSAGQAFQTAARAALEQIAWNAELVRAGTADPEAVHQARVGARRLRALLAGFDRIVEEAGLETLRGELKWLAGELDPARNLDVYAQGAWRRALGEQPDGALRSALDAAHARARAAAANPRFARLLIDALAWIETGPWTFDAGKAGRRRDRPVRRFVAGALARSLNAVVRGKTRLSALHAEARHAVRIRAKRLRYAADVFDQVFAENHGRARRFLAGLEDLLEHLGELNDIENARLLAPCFGHAERVLAAEAAREGELLARADRAFRALRQAQPFWPIKT
jgi:triphosphatase